MDEEKTNNINFSNKVGFIIGFIAVIIALYPFKQTLDSIKINLLIVSPSLTLLIAIFLGLLFLSIYFYALNYIRYDFPSLLNIEWLRFIEFLAHLMYFIAFLYPLFVLAVWVLSLIINLFPQISIKEVYYILLVLSSASLVLISIFIQILKIRGKEEELYERVKHFSKRSSELYQKGSHDFIFLYLYNSLVKLIQLKLTKRLGSDIDKISTIELIELAHRRKLISKDDLYFINELRALRNQVAHRDRRDIFTKKKIEPFIKRANEISKKLGYRISKYH